MVSIVTKQIKGNKYLYLVESVRRRSKVIQKNIKYIGKERPISKHEFNCIVISYEKKDWVLNEFIEYLSYQDHRKMQKASAQQKKYLKSLDSMSREKEKERFLSTFIAHSNAIEGSTMSVDDTFNYLFNDIVPSGHNKKELFMATNMLKAGNYLEENYTSFPTKQNLLELHKLVNNNIESERTLGKYKPIQNYVGEEYTTSYLFVEERVNDLLNWIKQAFKKIDDFEVAFQSHAQFEIIHPFVDGNGRVGRLLMNWILMYRGLMYFAIRVEKREEYIAALKNSRRGKVEAISHFCFKEYIDQYAFFV